MPLNLRIINPKEFIIFSQEGIFNKKESIDVLSKIVILNRSSNILIDLRKAEMQKLTHLDMVDITEYMLQHEEVFIGNKIAILSTPSQYHDPESFFEKYSRRKGLFVRVFDSYENAIEWLSNSSQTI